MRRTNDAKAVSPSGTMAEDGARLAARSPIPGRQRKTLLLLHPHYPPPELRAPRHHHHPALIIISSFVSVALALHLSSDNTTTRVWCLRICDTNRLSV